MADEGVVTLSYSYILNNLWCCNAYFQLERTVGSGSHGMSHLSFRTVRRTRPASERCWSAAGGWRLRKSAGRSGKKYLFKICNVVIVGWRGVACFGQRAGGRPFKQPISRDAGLVGVHWAFGVQTKG